MVSYPQHITVDRARIAIKQVIVPSVYSDHVPLQTGVYQCEEPIAYEAALEAAYQPVELGFTWGPAWSTAWFRLRGEVPNDFGEEFRLLFDTRTEALCWWDGAPYQGVELHRQDVKLPDTVRPGDALDVMIEAACNHMSGVGDKFADPMRMGEFPITRSGKLTLAHVARYHPQRAQLLHDFESLTNLVDTLPDSSPRYRQAAELLRRACTALTPTDLDRCIPEVRGLCQEALQTGAASGANVAHCVGNAHIDLAWLWPIRETKRKASRSFSTVLRYMQRHPEYRYIQSQPQLYEWVRQDYPALFTEIQERVKEGRWEAAGAMWVEADCNIPSGESLVRQIQHGVGYFEKYFDTPQRYLWLPDVFGYSAALPQILKNSGIEAFITQKISWNQFNKFPHHSFNWVGIDGTSIPSHFLPADTYIGQNTPDELDRGDRQYAQSGVLPAWLQAYGWGDGGGGPTEDSIERVARYADCEGMPRTRHSSVQSFVDKLLDASDRLPVWAGELYLELHRGTYTTQAKLKQGNRRGEVALRQVELVQSLVGATAEQRATLDQAWKDLLLNQFHDIIPGSSIAWVNREARALYDSVIERCEQLITDGLHAPIDAASPATGLMVLNTRSRGTGGLIELGADITIEADTQATHRPDGTPIKLAAIPDQGQPGLHVVPFERLASGTASGLKAQDLTLENEHLRVELDTAGRIVRLLDKATGREAIDAKSPANQFVLYDDRPIAWDAWDLEVYYRESGQPVDTPAEHAIVEDGPLRAAIEFKRPIGTGSHLVQRVQLDRDAGHVTFDTRVDWQEERCLLRVLHPVVVHNDHAMFEIQYGYVRRPNHFNTSWDYARFESVAHRWVDLSEPGFGVSLLNDCKYGHSCHNNVLGMSLLRSPREPDEAADVGTHTFRYALAPHGSFDAAAITCLAEALNQPLRAWPHHDTGADTPAMPIRVTGDAADQIGIEAVKPAENGDGVIVRLRELAGGRCVVQLEADADRAVVETDLLERAMDPASADLTSNPVSFTPFQLRTFRVGAHRAESP